MHTYIGMVAQKISALQFGDVIGWSSCASMLRVRKFYVYFVAATLPHPTLYIRNQVR